MAANFMQRRSLDPFSDEARFPSLVQSDAGAINDTKSGLDTASAQHFDAVAGGPNSVAARFDPANNGSIFSRQFPGAFDAAHDASLAQDPSNNYFNGMARKGSGTIDEVQPLKAAPQLSATDQYALDKGYMPDGSYKPPTFNSATNSFGSTPAATSPTPSLRKRIIDGVSTFDNGN